MILCPLGNKAAILSTLMADDRPAWCSLCISCLLFRQKRDAGRCGRVYWLTWSTAATMVTAAAADVLPDEHVRLRRLLQGMIGGRTTW